LALTALSLTPCHPPSDSVLSFTPFRLVFSRCRSSEEKNKPETARKGKTMKLEEVNKRTKETVDFLVAALESGDSEVLTAYLGAMAKFHTYSFGNIMLIARQKPDATNVAGLRSCKELPALTEVNGDVRGYRKRLFKFVESQSVELSFSAGIAPARGLSHGGKITLLSGMQPAEEFSTLVHEIAHEMLHRGERRTLTTKQVRETEAEAVAFVVCQSVGLQNATASQDYIQLWQGDANLLRESLEAVQQTATVILGAISPEEAGSQLLDGAARGWLGPALRFKMESMENGYKTWISKVQEALSSINMSMDDWQSRWPFDFEAEYKCGTKADDAAVKANRFWWYEQNKSLTRDCRKIPGCWLPRGHQGACQPLNSDSGTNSRKPTYQRGDYVKVEFPDEVTGIGEWMWVRITRCDEEKELIFGVLDNEPVNDYRGTLVLGSELAIDYSQVREHRKPTEFTRQ
jgi:hypothetical protein